MRFHERTILNLLYRFDPATWGNGLATEAATASSGGLGKTVRNIRSLPACGRRTWHLRESPRALGRLVPSTWTAPGYDGHDLIYVSQWAAAS